MAKDFLSMVSPSPQDVEHFGVKGMKWGIRKSDGSRGVIRRGATKANVSLSAGAKVITEGEKKLLFLPQKNRQKAATATQTRLLGEAAKINRSPQFRGKDLKKSPQLKASYFKKLEEAAKTIYAEELGISRVEAWGEFLGMDTKSATNQMRITAVSSQLRHANEDPQEVLLEMNFEVDEMGQVTKINVPDEFLHGSLEDENYLAHFGVKGMKWGIRKSDTSGGTSSSGSKGPIPKAPANEGHAEKYNRLRSQIKTHGPNSLSPEELNFVNARTEAIAKINKMNVASPGWLSDTTKVVMQETTKTLMKDLAVRAGKEFIVKPLIKGK